MSIYNILGWYLINEKNQYLRKVKFNITLIAQELPKQYHLHNKNLMLHHAYINLEINFFKKRNS